MKFKFNVAVEVMRADPPHEIEAKIEGTPLGIVGRLTASSVTRLAEDGDGTKISYEIEAALTGKLGSLGQPVLRSKAKEMGTTIRRTHARGLRAGADARGSDMTPFELAEPASLRDADRAARSRRFHGASDRRRHRPDADDEGRRVPADAAGEPAQAGVAIFAHSGGRRWRAHDRRHDAAGGGRAIAPRLHAHAPVITRDLRTLSNVRVRNVATIGGHLAHGDPHMDLPPVLIALGAEVAIAGPAGERTVAVEDLFAGYFETVLAKNELIAELRHSGTGQIAAPPTQGAPRGAADDWPALGVAVVAGGRGRRRQSRARSSSAPRPRRRRVSRSAEEVLAGATIDDATARAAPAMRRPRKPSVITDSPRLGRLQDVSCFASMWAAPCGKPSTNARFTTKPATATERGADGNQHRADGGTARVGDQVGRSLPAARRRARRSPAAPNTSTTCGCPACCYGKIFRSTVAHGRIKSHRHQRGTSRCAGVYRVVTIDDVRKVIPEPVSTARPSTTSRSWRSTRCTTSASRSRWCWPPIPHVAEEAAQLIVAEYEELPAVFDEVEAMTSTASLVHDELKPAGTFADLKHLQGHARTPISRSISSCAAATSTRPSPRPTHVFEHTFRTQKVLHLAARAVRLDRETGKRRASPSTPPRRGRRSCASRSRACSAGRRTACASRCRISAAASAPSSTSSSRRWWRRSRMIVRRPVKIALTMEEQFYTITKHASTFRIKSGVDKDGRIIGAQVRGVVERRRLCRHRPARDAEVGLHRLRPLRHRQRLDRFLRALHQPAAGRRAARLRHSRSWCGPTRATPT